VPNLSQGYARSEAESAYPNLWKGLRGLWLPGIRTGGFGTNAVRDFSGRAHHGTMNGSMTTDDWVIVSRRPGLGGYALDIDGVNDYVDLGTSSRNLLVGATESTLLMWVYDKDSTLDTLVGTYNVAGAGFAVEVNRVAPVVNDPGKIYVFLRDAAANDLSGNSTNDVITTNTLYHIAVVADYRDSTITMYVDGNSVAFSYDSQDSLGSMDAWGQNLYLGALNNVGSVARPVLGRIADVRIYDRALKPYEIRQIYRGASPLTLRQRVVGRAPVVTGGPWPHHMDNQGLVGGFSSLGI